MYVNSTSGVQRSIVDWFVYGYDVASNERIGNGRQDVWHLLLETWKVYKNAMIR
jgi:hypothetical protein